MIAPTTNCIEMRLLTGKHGSGWFRRRRWWPWIGSWPFLSGYWIRQARKAARTGHWGSATRAYETFLGVSPELARVWVQYGHALKEQGELRRAERAYGISAQLAPSADTYVHLGHVVLRSSRTEDAARAFFRALAIDPDCVPARDGLAAAGVAPDAIASTLERGTLSTAGQVDEATMGAPLQSPNFRTLAAPRFHRPAGTPVADAPGLSRAVSEILAGSGGEYPSYCTVAVDQQRLVGWAFLPFDFHHRVLVNAYHRGRLVACTLANRTRPSELTSGPRYNWFEISWHDWPSRLDPDQLKRLVLQRGEDGQIWGGGLDRPQSRKLNTDELVEAELLDANPTAPNTELLHRLPTKVLIELYYWDYLGRSADPESVAHYTRACEGNAISIDDFRDELLHSDEFARRDIRPHHRLGRATMIRALSLYEAAPFEPQEPPTQYDRVSPAELTVPDNSRFLDACYSTILRRRPSRRVHQTLLAALEENRMSRLDALRELVLQAASNGRFVQVDDVPRLLDRQRLALRPAEPEGAVS
jgi:hypothetical protein